MCVCSTGTASISSISTFISGIAVTSIYGIICSRSTHERKEEIGPRTRQACKHSTARQHASCVSSGLSDGRLCTRRVPAPSRELNYTTATGAPSNETQPQHQPTTTRSPQHSASCLPVLASYSGMTPPLALTCHGRPARPRSFLANRHPRIASSRRSNETRRRQGQRRAKRWQQRGRRREQLRLFKC